MSRSDVSFRVVAVLFTCLAAYAAVRNCVVANAVEQGGAGPSLMPPQDTRLLLRAVLVRRPDATQLARSARTARILDPLDDAAFVLRGQADYLQGRFSAARDAFTVAKAMDPRASAGRVGLIDTLIQSGDGAGALSETFALLRLRSDLDSRVIPALMAVAHEPQGREALLAASRRDPEIAARLLSRASATAGQEALTGALLTLPLPAKDRSDAIAAVAARGDYRLAYRLWTGRSSSPSLIRDDFRARQAPEPFRWTALQDPNASATSGSDGGLAVTATGTLPVALAEQVLLLAPGKYALDVVAQRVSGGSFQWRLTCAKTDEVVAEPPALQGPGTARAVFAVAPDCPVQRLVVSGSALDPSGTAAALFTRLAIRKGAP